MDHLFQGSALNAVDAKGRVSVPAFLRQVIERRGDARSIVLAKHALFPCLEAYDPGHASAMHAKMERRAEKNETATGSDLSYATANMMAFGASEDVAYDKSGRIVIPPMMKMKGKIDDLALFVGVGETFHLWNPKLFLEDKNIPEDMKDIARFRMEERGITL